MRPAHGRRLRETSEARQGSFLHGADILGLAKVLAPLRPDITYPGDPGATIHKRHRPPCTIKPETDDVDWIPTVTQHGWLIITRDSAIQVHPAEIDAVVNNGAKMVALSGKDARNKWAMLEVVMTQWRQIDKLADIPAPFVYKAYRTSLTKVA